MLPSELRALKVGDRIEWRGTDLRPADKPFVQGEVTHKANGMAHIRWADGKAEWLGWRSDVDKARGRNIALLPSGNPTPPGESPADSPG